MGKSILALAFALAVLGCGGGGGDVATGPLGGVLVLQPEPTSIAAVGNGGTAIGSTVMTVSGFTGRFPVRWNGTATPHIIGLIPGIVDTPGIRVVSDDLQNFAGIVSPGGVDTLYAYSDGKYELGQAKVDGLRVDLWPSWISQDGMVVLGGNGQGAGLYYRWDRRAGTFETTTDLGSILPNEVVAYAVLFRGPENGYWDGSSFQTLLGLPGHESTARITAFSKNGRWATGTSSMASPEVPGLTVKAAVIWGPDRVCTMPDALLIGWSGQVVSNDGRVCILQQRVAGEGNMWIRGRGFVKTGDMVFGDISPDSSWLGGAMGLHGGIVARVMPQ